MYDIFSNSWRLSIAQSFRHQWLACRARAAVAVSNERLVRSLVLCSPLTPFTLTGCKEGPDQQAVFNVNFFCHNPTTAKSKREARWRTTLSPYYPKSLE
jgi:hypothetical protein